MSLYKKEEPKPMRMDIWQQINYRDKMYKRLLGAHNLKTKELYTPEEAMKEASEMLMKKMEYWNGL